MIESKVIPPSTPTIYKEMSALPPRNTGEVPEPVESNEKSKSPKENVKSIAEQEKEKSPSVRRKK